MGKKTDKNTYCVYVHVFPNGKRYYGQTCVDPETRWRKGKRYSGLMRKAIEKYGWENIEHTVLITNLSLEEADAFEMSLISQFRTCDPEYGYNITHGGDGYKGAKHSKETKEKLRKIALEQWKRQKSQGYKPPEITPEQRKHLSESHKGQKPWNKGLHTMTDSMKEKLKDARYKYWDGMRKGDHNE